MSSCLHAAWCNVCNSLLHTQFLLQTVRACHAVSGVVPEEPVITKNGHLFEKQLIEKAIAVRRLLCVHALKTFIQLRPCLTSLCACRTLAGTP